MTLDPLLAPVVIYLAGAFLLAVLRPFTDNRTHRLIGLASVTVAFVTVILIYPASDTLVRWTLSNWGDAAGTGRGITFRADTLSMTYLLLTAVVGMGVFVGSLDDPDESDAPNHQSGLLLLLAGIAALALSDNVRTLLLVGLVLDIGLLFGVGLTGRARWFSVLVFHSIIAQGLLIIATLVLYSETGATNLSSISQVALWCALAAAIVRMAPLPFCLYPLALETLPQRVLGLLPLATLGVGSLLLARVSQFTEYGSLPDYGGLGAVAAVGVALAGWVAWRSQENSSRLMMLSAAQAAWVLWAFAWGVPELGILTALGAVPALAALAVHGGQVDFRHGVQAPAFLAVLVLIGVPGSALWNAMTTLSGEGWWRDLSRVPLELFSWQSLMQPTAWLTLAAVVGVMTATATLLGWLVTDTPRAAQKSRWTGVFLLAILSVPFIAELLGLRVNPLSGAVLADTPRAAQWILPITGWVGGLWLWRARRTVNPLHPLLDGAAAVFSLAWLYRLLGRIGWLLLRGVRGVMLLLEGENYGWLLLFLFVTLLVLTR